jgi:hypothetical protein
MEDRVRAGDHRSNRHVRVRSGGVQHYRWWDVSTFDLGAEREAIASGVVQVQDEHPRLRARQQRP